MPKKKSDRTKKLRPKKTIRNKKQPSASSSGPLHPMKVPPSKTFPDGHITTRHEHCRHNPSGRDQFYPDEIHEIAKEHFSKVKKRPCPLPLKFGSSGSAYDELIAGWVQYWNELLTPDVPLEPNLFKALVASESSFDPNILADRKNPKSARGLTQITDDTRKILGDEKGELKDHHITATREEMNDPNISIYAGVRWLFHKRHLASSKLGRMATWEEAVAEYKSIRQGLKRGVKRDKVLMDRFLKYLEDYRKCGTK